VKILINALGIRDSGGLKVLDKFLAECTLSFKHSYLVIFNENKKINKLIERYKEIKILKFKALPVKGFIYRIYYENIEFNRIAKKNIDLIYNFSGTSQPFLKIPQLLKIQNLIFYSKKLDLAYKKQSKFILWLKQIYVKRFIFNFMLNRSQYIEIQSRHVKKHISDFVRYKEKVFFIKSDICVNNSQFLEPKNYNFRKKIKFLYIVGPHFEYVHKNFIDFTNAMLEFSKLNVDFEINITLSKKQLESSLLWNNSLNKKTNFIGYISDQVKMKELFCDNTILISTSIIETLGLHVIEGIKNGVITIVPDEEYANIVYGENMFQYELFNRDSLVDTIMSIINCKESCSENILSIQDDLRQGEMSKFSSILDVFDEVLNVQK
jgi:hypothetical protein